MLCVGEQKKFTGIFCGSPGNVGGIVEWWGPGKIIDFHLVRSFLILLVSLVSRTFGIVFGIAIPFFLFFSFLIHFGIVFGIDLGIVSIPTILVSLVFLPRDTKTKSIAGIAVFITSVSAIY